MSKSSSKIRRVIYEWDDFFSCHFYLVFYSSGAIRKYNWLTVPATVTKMILDGPCVCWRGEDDGDEYWVYDIMEVNANV